MIDKQVLENTIAYLKQNKDDLKKQQANLMEIFCQLRDFQKEIDKYVVYLEHELENDNKIDIYVTEKASM